MRWSPRSHQRSVGRTARAAALVVVVGVGVGVAAPARATTSDERARVASVADQLDNLHHQMDTTNEDYLTAIGRNDQLKQEIAVLQVKVDRQAGKLSKLQGLLTRIAVDRFTSSGSASSNPLLSNAASFEDAQQRDRLAQVALNQGIEDADNAQEVVDQLNSQQRTLDKKKAEARALVGALNSRKKKLDSLESQYTKLLADAKRDLGKAIVEEQERRERERQAKIAAALKAKIEEAKRKEAERQAAIARAKARRPKPTTRRGGGTTGGTNTGGNNTGGNNTGGNNTGGNNTGGNNTGGSKGGNNTPPPPPPPPRGTPVSGKAGIAVSAAMAQRGTPYRFAASSPGVAFDCSGLTKYAWGRAGVYLPHQSAQQYASVPHVSESSAAPGDLIFYYSPITHVGLYIGGGAMVHAPRTGDVVKVVGVQWGKTVGVGRPG